MACNLEEKGPELVVLAWEMLGIAEVVLQWECIIIKVRECAYMFVLCTVMPGVQDLVPIFMLACINIIKAANRQQHKQPK